MRTRALNLWESFRTGFWFVPSLMAAGAVAMAFSLVAIDRRASLDSPFEGISPEGARALLAAIAGSMITVAGVVFSITIVALTLASSQFGPRLLRNFVRDLGNQVVLGTFVATFLYCLLVLASLRDSESTRFVPHLSVSFGILLAILSIGVLIYFFDHVTGSIQANQVVARVYRELRESMEQMVPDSYHQAPASEESEDPLARSWAAESLVRSSASGYLQAIDLEGLVTYAREKDLVVMVKRRPGEFIILGTSIAAVYASGELPERLEKRINGFFILGSSRTYEQDLEFAVDQLVDVATRALSPGINDPGTAIACIDWLGAAIAELSHRSLARSHRADKDGHLRLVLKVSTFEGLVDAAFNPIRHHGSSIPAVAIRLLETLAFIAEGIDRPEQREVVRRHGSKVLEASLARQPIEADRRDIEERFRALSAALA